MATGGPDGLQVHQYAPSRLRAGGLAVDIDPDYPWHGRVTVTVREAPQHQLKLALRVPDWAEGATLDGAAVPAGGHARLRRPFRVGERVVLDLPMPRGCWSPTTGSTPYAAASRSPGARWSTRSSSPTSRPA